MDSFDEIEQKEKDKEAEKKKAKEKESGRSVFVIKKIIEEKGEEDRKDG